MSSRYMYNGGAKPPGLTDVPLASWVAGSKNYFVAPVFETVELLEEITGLCSSELGNVHEQLLANFEINLAGFNIDQGKKADQLSTDAVLCEERMCPLEGKIVELLHERRSVNAAPQNQHTWNAAKVDQLEVLEMLNIYNKPPFILLTVLWNKLNCDDISTSMHMLLTAQFNDVRIDLSRIYLVQTILKLVDSESASL